MSSHISFTNNYKDLSTEKGFQFKFSCGRCGNGYKSGFQPNVLGMAGGALGMASRFLGGAVGRAATSAQDLQRLIAGPAHDAAMRAAVAEVAPQFNQCGCCGQWVCRKICWNGERDQCVSCSPKMDQELASIESQGAINQLREKIRYGLIDLTAGATLNSPAAGQQSVGALRPCTCGKQIPRGAKFCSHCGKDVALRQTCPNCSVESSEDANFCSGCRHRFKP